MTLKTLDDVRTLIGHLPAAELEKAVDGADPADASIALRMVPMLEGVECRPAR
jgi:hypothetical protein